MVVSTRAREDFLLSANELVRTVEELVKQKNAKSVNQALVKKAELLMKKMEESSVDVERPLLDARLVREYHAKLYNSVEKLLSVLSLEFWKSFSAISRAYNIPAN